MDIEWVEASSVHVLSLMWWYKTHVPRSKCDGKNHFGPICGCGKKLNQKLN